MITPAASWYGAAYIAIVTILWVALVRPPGRVFRSSLLLGLGLFLPYFLLMPLVHEESAVGGWPRAFEVPWIVFFKGITAMQASICTASALSASALRQGLSDLPVPRIFSAVLIQIVHQTTNLISETRRVSSAISLRGGTRGYRTGILVLTSLPRVWLPRVVDRAERVGAAMELRGYCERDLEETGVATGSWRDRLAVGAALVIMAGATAFRFLGGS